MPPRIRYDREALVEAALSIARREGMAGLNARAIAKHLGCSTQPIYRELKNMEELRLAVFQRAQEFFEAFVTRQAAIAPSPYLSSGIAYLRFAREEKALFQLLFMRERTRAEMAPERADATFSYAVDLISRATGYDREKAVRFHYHSYVYVHGLAVMIATGFMAYDEAELTRLLRHQYQALRLLYDGAGPSAP